MSRKWLVFLVKFAVSVGLIGYLMIRIDLNGVLARLAAVEPLWIAAALVLLVVQVGVATLRWRATLVAIRALLPFSILFRLFYVGAFFNQILPSSVGGDAVRIYAAWRAGLEVGPAIIGVMLERVATIIALVIVVAAVLPLFIGRVDEGFAVWWPWAVGGFAVAVLGGLAVLMILDRLPATIRHWRLVRGLIQFATDTRTVFLNPKHATRILVWSAIGHFNVAVAVFVLARGLALPIELLDCVALIPPVILVTTVPISIAGWGVRESAMVTAFAAIGVSNEGAVALSILLGLAVAVASLPGGLLWLASAERHASAGLPDPKQEPGEIVGPRKVSEGPARSEP